MAGGLQQESGDDHSLLRQHRACVEGIPTVISAADEGGNAGIHLFDVGGGLVDAEAASQPGDGGWVRKVPQPGDRVGKVADPVCDLFGDLAHVAVGVAVRCCCFNVPTFNVSRLSEGQGTTVQNQHGVILPHSRPTEGGATGEGLTATRATDSCGD